MSEYNLIEKAEALCTADWKILTEQISETDPKTAEALNVQMNKIREAMEENPNLTAKDDLPAVLVGYIGDAMTEMLELAADHVFEYEKSDTKEMQKLFETLGFQSGDGNGIREQIENLRMFGRDGKLEKEIDFAGELSDSAIPVIEALRELREHFSYRDGKTIREYSNDGFFETEDLEKLKKACSEYRPLQKDTKEEEKALVEILAKAVDRTKRMTRNMEKKSQKEKLSFRDILQEEDRSKSMDRRVKDRNSSMQFREKKTLYDPQIGRTSRSL